MPDKRRHRGPHPEDEQLFAPSCLASLRKAASDLSWLLDQAYAPNASLTLVGDHYALTQRQRIALARCTCSETSLHRRRQHCIRADRLRGEELWLDGYNLLIGLEAALGGGVILKARDGCFRDMASLHGSYRRVEETVPALHLVGEWALKQGIARCHWFLDSPVSNSGRLKSLMQDVAARLGWNWQVELAQNPDAILAGTEHVVATSDSVILDRCSRWTNALPGIVSVHVPEARIVDLWPEEPAAASPDL